MEHDWHTSRPVLRCQLAQAFLPLHLHHCFHCIHGHKANAHACSSSRREQSLNWYWQIARCFVLLEERHNTCIGSSVAEPRYGPLNEGRSNASVETRNAT